MKRSTAPISITSVGEIALRISNAVLALAAAVTLAGFAGCAEMRGLGKDVTDADSPQEHQARDCHGRDCDVTIAFICSDKGHPTPATCTPFADPELIAVDKGHKIRFTISNAWPFTFAMGDGIRSNRLLPVPVANGFALYVQHQRPGRHGAGNLQVLDPHRGLRRRRSLGRQLLDENSITRQRGTDSQWASAPRGATPLERVRSAALPISRAAGLRGR